MGNLYEITIKVLTEQDPSDAINEIEAGISSRGYDIEEIDYEEIEN